MIFWSEGEPTGQTILAQLDYSPLYQVLEYDKSLDAYYDSDGDFVPRHSIVKWTTIE